MLGNGDVNARISGLMLTGETFLIMRENKETKKTDLYVKEMDMKITSQEQELKLENLLGGGLVGSVADSILGFVGDKLVFNKLYTSISDKAKIFFRKELSKFLKVELIDEI